MGYDRESDPLVEVGDTALAGHGDSRTEFEEHGRAGFGYEVRVDIKNFVPSFYTHSLP